MTTYTGQNGVISVARSAGSPFSIAEVRGFTFEQEVETIDASVMGDTYRAYKTGMINASGSADLLFSSEHAATIIDIMNDKEVVTMTLYPGGNTATYPTIVVKAHITNYSMESTMDDMVTASITFQVDGGQSTPVVYGTAS